MCDPEDNEMIAAIMKQCPYVKAPAEIIVGHI